MKPSQGVVPALTERLKAELYLGQWNLDRGEFDQAFLFFSKAAVTGHPVALNMLGRSYERGWGVMRDVVRARTLFEAAIDAGDGWACFNLADLYLVGDGVPRHLERAYMLYVEAARRGVTKSYNMLGLLHEEGFTDHPPDRSYAIQLYKAGADTGDKWAYLNLERIREARSGRYTT